MAEVIRAVTRKWGNSIAVVIPKEIVDKQKIREDEEVNFTVEKKRVFTKDLFGALKGWKIDAQKAKDEIRMEEKLAEERKWKRLNIS